MPKTYIIQKAKNKLLNVKHPSKQQTGNNSKIRLLIVRDFLHVHIFITIAKLKHGTQIINCVRMYINT